MSCVSFFAFLMCEYDCNMVATFLMRVLCIDFTKNRLILYHQKNENAGQICKHFCGNKMDLFHVSMILDICSTK